MFDAAQALKLTDRLPASVCPQLLCADGRCRAVCLTSVVDDKIKDAATAGASSGSSANAGSTNATTTTTSGSSGGGGSSSSSQKAAMVPANPDKNAKVDEKPKLELDLGE